MFSSRARSLVEVRAFWRRREMSGSMDEWKVDHTRSRREVRENRAPLQSLQKRQRLVVAASLEVVRQLRVDRRRQLMLQRSDAFRYGLQLFEVQRGVAAIQLAISDHGQTLAQRGGEGLIGRNGFRHGGSLPQQAVRP